MGHTFVISGLRDKRARMAGELAVVERDLAKRREALATIDAVIRMFEPDSNPDMIPPIRPAGRSLFFRRGELSRLCLSALRDAGKPVRCRTVAEWVIAAKGLEVPDTRVRDRIIEKVRLALRAQSRKGIVRKVVDWPDAWWDLG
jgi:hypothetical protein